MALAVGNGWHAIPNGTPFVPADPILPTARGCANHKAITGEVK